MNKIYLDNSASAPIRREVIDVMTHVYENIHGNPSSLHAAGFEAENVITEARRNILKALKMQGRIIFCGSGTEANNLAVSGTIRAKNRKVKRIVTTDSEHPSILEAVKVLDDVEVVFLSTKHGVIDIEEVKNAVNEDTMLVSVMLVNNETGAVYDVKTIFDAVKRINPAAVTHCDAVQGFGRVCGINADLITLSAHKIHGPKGIGALFCKEQVITSKRLVSIIYGGGQERGFRSGTENTAGIAGFGEAVKYKADINLRDHLIENLPVKVNIPHGEYAPHIISITLPRIKSETMLHYLSGKGIYVSSGSACSKNKRSHVLLAFGLNEMEADCSLRISLSAFNTIEEIDRFIIELKNGLDSLIRM
ncbi:MAG: cysteine desulfurase [Oscillospiraceae bacterium]|nr:cysteine desulfurase [Oscillospiraceae bacterium]